MADNKTVCAGFDEGGHVGHEPRHLRHRALHLDPALSCSDDTGRGVSVTAPACLKDYLTTTIYYFHANVLVLANRMSVYDPAHA